MLNSSSLLNLFLSLIMLSVQAEQYSEEDDNGDVEGFVVQESPCSKLGSCFTPFCGSLTFNCMELRLSS